MECEKQIFYNIKKEKKKYSPNKKQKYKNKNKNKKKTPNKNKQTKINKITITVNKLEDFFKNDQLTREKCGIFIFLFVE